MKRILGLDLGTTTGFAVGSEAHMVSGTWNLKPSRWDGGGMVYVKFRQRLDELHNAYAVDEVAFEEVRRHLGTDAAHRFGGLMATLTAWCEEKRIPYRGVPVGTIKKSFTGNGAASKQMMIAECERRGFAPKDDNESDAIAVFDYVLKEYAALERLGAEKEPALAAE